MRYFFVWFLIAVFIGGCNGGGGSGSSPGSGSVSNAPALKGESEKFYWQAFVDGNALSVLFIQIQADGKAKTGYIHWPDKGNLALGHYQKNEGTFSRSGDMYTFNYSYETCNPVGSETFEILTTENKAEVWLKKDGVLIKFYDDEYYAIKDEYTNQMQAFAEDTSCTY